MLFNSIGFLLFLPIVFIIYWFVVNRNLKAQNIFLVCASYLFYGWWDYRFLALIAISTVVDFFVGLALQREEVPKARKFLVGISLFVNLGMLGFFKYYNFFVDSWVDAWAGLGVEMHVSTLQIILPVGISFYTFQTLSYTFDVYRKKIQATNSLINFAAFVAFFPQLVAGPIERASKLLTQIAVKRSFNTELAISGIHLILWGLFKKIVIADSCATYVDAIFNNYQDMNTMSLALGIVYFNFQVYCDFSGYSDIAVGTARLFGIELSRNFNYPYFSRNIVEFWQRWHITLTSWFAEYVFTPLSFKFRRFGKRGLFLVVVINFALIGLWHGAQWTFILFSLFNAFFFFPFIINSKNRKFSNQVAYNTSLPSIKEVLQMLSTFSIVALSCVFFRSDTIETALAYFKGLFFKFTFGVQHLLIDRYSVEILLLLGIFIWIEWVHKKYEHPFIGKFKWVKIVGVISMLLTLGVYSDYKQFIYFQF